MIVFSIFYTLGNTWIAENLGNLIKTLTEIGDTFDSNEHSEIFVRKNGELIERQRRSRRRRFIQEESI